MKIFLCLQHITVIFILQDSDSQITELYIRYDRQQEMMSQLHESLVSLPILVSHLQQATDLLGEI